MAARVFCLWRKAIGRLWLADAVRAVPCRTVVSPRPGFDCEFRSEYSLDKLYPSEQKETDIRKDSAKQLIDIPVDRLSISYCRSSGPGGQNVNKVNTKAEVRFHLASADWISEDVRQKMAVMQKNKISKTGELIVSSEVSRYQMRNLADCLQKIRDMIAEATEILQVPVKSKEDAETIRNRVEKMNHERLRQKKMWSSIKQSRHVDVD